METNPIDVYEDAHYSDRATNDNHQQADESDIDEDLWTSPTQTKPPPLPAPQKTAKSRNKETSHADQDAREEALRRELESVRKVNEAIEGAIESLAKARNSMKTVNTTVSSASALLSTWTKILSQTEHNQRLILNPSWQGASQDLADAEQEVFAKQQASERREYEEQERRAAAARKAEDDERRKTEAATRVSRGMSRGRGRGSGRGGSSNPTPNTSYVGVGGQGAVRGTTRSGSAPRRTSSGIGRGIGRGIGSIRGRSRG